MNRKKAIEFILTHSDMNFYQPVVFIPKLLEIKGKWDQATKLLANHITRNIKDKTILDLGCNYGFFLHEAIRHGAKTAVGIDHDPIVVDIAIEVNSIIDDGALIYQEDIESFEIKTKFDIILMLNVLHVIKDPLSVINKYLSWTSDCLIIEHENSLTPRLAEFNHETKSSERAANSRNLTVISL